MSNFCGGYTDSSYPSLRRHGYTPAGRQGETAGRRDAHSQQGHGQTYWGGFSNREGGGQRVASGESSTRTSISELSPHQPNTVIVGIVATKQNVFSFPDKRNPGSERYKISFTLRDSPSDYINVTCWGSEQHIRGIAESFKICDVVEIQNAQITSKSGGEAEDRWRPWTPSQYQVNVSEVHSSVSMYSGWDYTEFAALAHVPLRPPNDYYPLGDIMANGQSLDGSFVNILAIVKSPGSPKQMTSKSGRPLRKCDVRLMDEGCGCFSLFMWDDELIDLAQSWTPKENIIFAVDVKISFDSYRNCMVGTCTQKTIITTNPDCREAHQLYQYAQTLEIDTISEEDTRGPSGSAEDLKSITQVYTVEQLNSDLAAKAHSSSITGITYAFLTSLNIDGEPGSVISYRCSSCKYRVDGGACQCQNKSCPSLASHSFACEPNYSILVSLSDSTAGLDGVRLSGQPATELMSCTVQEFLAMTGEERTRIKCNHLLEKFKVYFKSDIQLPHQRRPSVRVLSMSLADPEEAVNSLQF